MVVVVDDSERVAALEAQGVETGMQVVSVASNDVSRKVQVTKLLQNVSEWPVSVVFRVLPLEDGQELCMWQ